MPRTTNTSSAKVKDKTKSKELKESEDTDLVQEKILEVEQVEGTPS